MLIERFVYAAPFGGNAASVNAFKFTNVLCRIMFTM